MLVKYVIKIEIQFAKAYLKIIHIYMHMVKGKVIKYNIKYKYNLNRTFRYNISSRH